MGFLGWVGQLYLTLEDRCLYVASLGGLAQCIPSPISVPTSLSQPSPHDGGAPSATPLAQPWWTAQTNTCSRVWAAIKAAGAASLQTTTQVHNDCWVIAVCNFLELVTFGTLMSSFFIHSTCPVCLAMKNPDSFYQGATFQDCYGLLDFMLRTGTVPASIVPSPPYVRGQKLPPINLPPGTPRHTLTSLLYVRHDGGAPSLAQLLKSIGEAPLYLAMATPQGDKWLYYDGSDLLRAGAKGWGSGHDHVVLLVDVFGPNHPANPWPRKTVLVLLNTGGQGWGDHVS